MNYSNGKIYKIINDNKCYIGSTICELNDRLSGHKSSKKKYELTKKHYCSSFDLLNDNCKIELIELFPCNSKKELLIRERYWYDLLECVNIRKPYSTISETKQTDSISSKKWRENNKEYLQTFFKKYKQHNREYIRNHYKEWYEKNKDVLKQKRRDYELKKKKPKKILTDEEQQIIINKRRERKNELQRERRLLGSI